jgi:signal recognition particle subunit SRP54
MVFSNLGEAVRKITDKVAAAIFVDKKLVDSIIKDLQRALIEADININLVKELSDKIRKAAVDEKVKGVEKREHIIKLLHDELLEMLGGEKAELKVKKAKKKPIKIMLLGLYGSGKTTTTAKLANYYGKRGFKTCMLGIDVHRPAAPEQLEQLAKQHNLPAFIDKTEKNPEKIYDKFKDEIEDYDLVLIDTAGRHSLDKALVKEIKQLGKKINPDFTILIMPADIGQAAKKQAEEFQKALDINGVIITRMDSSAKGGGALTACNETNAPVYFITTGEKINDFETFSARRFISRILGLGDLETLLEKVRSVVEEKEEKKLKKRVEEGKLTMDDLYGQLESMQKIGPLGKIAELIPGFGKVKMPENLMESQEERMKKWRFIIQSMTPEEKENPELLEKQTSRIQRIAKGSGTPASDVRALLKQYKILREFIKTGEQVDLSKGVQGISQKQLQKLAKKFGKKIKLG